MFESFPVIIKCMGIHFHWFENTHLKESKEASQRYKKNQQSTIIIIIKGFWTIVFIFIVISTIFWPIRLPAFFRCLSNLGTFTELQTMSFIESSRVACSDSVSHNWVQVLSIPVLLLTCSQDWTCKLLMIVSLEA